MSATPPAPHDWDDVLSRVLADRAAASELESLQSDVIDGRVLVTTGDRAIDAGRDIVGSVILLGDNNQVHLRLDDERIEALRRKLFPKSPGLPPPFPSLLFVGRAKAMDEIRKQIAHAGRGALVIVRGWPGVGKTTIMSAIGRDGRVLRQFADGVLWTSLGQSPSLLTSLAGWGSALGTDKVLRAPTLNAACEQIAPLLYSKEMLLLVDDVWDPAHLAPFQAIAGPRCAVVATTREPNVAEAFTANRAHVYPLPVLEEKYAVELFQAIAPEVAQQHRRESEELVRALECLPLAIHVAARLLATESKFGWGIENLIEDVKSGAAIVDAPAPDDRIEFGEIPSVAALLRKSTDRLSEPVREYYAYLGVFAPKPATFDLAALKAVWELDDPKPVVRELASRGLLEPVGQGRFQMHALLVAHARKLLS